MHLSNLLKSFDVAEYNIAEKMAKLLLYVFVALLTVSLIMAAATDKPTTPTCGRHGDPVSILASFIFLIKLFFLSLLFF